MTIFNKIGIPSGAASWGAWQLFTWSSINVTQALQGCRQASSSDKKKQIKEEKKNQIKHVQLKSMNATQTVQGCPSSGVGLRKNWNVCPAAAVNKIDKEADYQLFRSSAF